MFSEDTDISSSIPDNGNAGCGLDAFRKSAGGHLHDDIRARRCSACGNSTRRSANGDSGAGHHLQTFPLMQQALGLGGGIQAWEAGGISWAQAAHLSGAGLPVCRPPGKPMRQTGRHPGRGKAPPPS